MSAANTPSRAAGKPFDPTRHLIKLQGKDYLPVAARIMALREEHPDATITTEVIDHNPEERWCIIRAVVTLPSGGSASGMARQEPTGIAKDYIANGETSAIGRALGALGYGTQFALEFDQGGDVVDAPIERRPTAADLSGKQEPVKQAPPTPAPTPKAEPATKPVQPPAADLAGQPGPHPLPPHVRRMWAVKGETAWSDDQVKATMRRLFPAVASSRDLTPPQAQTLGDHMELARRMARRMDALWAADRIAEHLADCGVTATIDMTADQLGATEALLKAESGSIGVVGELAAAMR